MYACVSVCVSGCYVCKVSVFKKKTFTVAHVQHEEEEGNITSPIDLTREI